MAEINPEALRLVVAAVERYQQEVEASRLKPSAKQTYLLHANHFVRWLEGDFTPGGRL